MYSAVKFILIVAACVSVTAFGFAQKGEAMTKHDTAKNNQNTVMHPKGHTISHGKGKNHKVHSWSKSTGHATSSTNPGPWQKNHPRQHSVRKHNTKGHKHPMTPTPMGPKTGHPKGSN